MTTDTTVRIDLPLTDHSKRRNTVTKECYLVLHGDYMQYKVVSSYECLNEDTTEWEPFSANYRWTRKKSCIANIDMFLNNDADDVSWAIGMEFHGISKCMQWDFDDPKKALVIYNQLVDYMTL